MNGYQRAQFLSGFWIKIIALLTMTLSHIAVLLTGFISESNLLITTFNILGRIALPLFCFMIAEGVIYTKSFGKYSLRLGIMASIVSIGLIVAFTLKDTVPGAGDVSKFNNIFLDLLLGAVCVWLLRNPKWPIKLFALLPLAFSFTSTFVQMYEGSGTLIYWFPWFIRTQYGFYGVLLIVMFYLARVCKNCIFGHYSNKMGVDDDVIFPAGSGQLIINIFSIVFIAIATLLFWSVAGNCYSLWLDFQPYAILAGAFLLFYNGKRGYNSKWFKYGCYLNYPLHFAILAAIFLFLN